MLLRISGAQVGTEEGPSLREVHVGQEKPGSCIESQLGSCKKRSEPKCSICAYQWDEFDGQEDQMAF